MLIGLLMAGHAPEAIVSRHGDFDAMFARLLDGRGLRTQAFDVENMVFPDAVTACDGWLVSGSKHGAYEDHAFIAPLEAFVREAVAADIPVVGICFGHQIVAQALGGTVEKWPGGWAVGRRPYTLPDGETLHLNAWHQDQVTALPEGAEVLASNDHCANAIVAYGRRAFTVQPHPEFDGPILADFVAQRRGTGTYPDDLMDRAAETASAPVDAPRIGDAIARFLRTRQAHV